jgi:LuxR family maltose regulon positive regulatory protein
MLPAARIIPGRALVTPRGADYDQAVSADAVSAGVSAPGPVLVETKLHVPQVRAGMVSRRELVDRLSGRRERKLALLCAPAGWGKTMLLSEWRASEQERRSFAWVSLDPTDSDPVRFWSYLIAALRTVDPELGATSLAALPAAGTALIDAVVAPLINDLTRLERPLVLVLDDYHLVRHEAVHSSVAFLLRHLPPHLELGIASRADPPLPLGSLRVAGDVLEIRAAELRFSEAEADALLNGSLGLGIEPSDVSLLQQRTEGWAAGLQLAALSAQAHEDKHAFVAQLAGDDRQVGDYLHEVIASQPADLRQFLLRTSVLERMCADLCDAVTGDGGSAAQLGVVERSNLFLVPLDERREWYRYHHLFRDLLRHEVRRISPELVPELHRRAYAWHVRAGLVDEAIAHATNAGDVAEAGELIAEHWRRLSSLGQAETVARWIDELPREPVLGDARLCLARGWTALYLGSLDSVERWRWAAEQALVPGQLYHDVPSVAANAAMLEAVHANATGDVKTGIEAARRSLSLHPDQTTPSFGAASGVLGMCLYDAGRYAEAARALDEGVQVLLDENWITPLFVSLGCLAAAYVDLGEVDRAERAAAEAERIVDELQVHEAPWVARTRLARGKLLELSGDLAAAEASFLRAVVLARRGGRRLELPHALLLLARLKRRQRDHAAARSLTREARDAIAGCRDPGILGELLAGTERALQLTSAPRGAAEQLPVDVELSERELTVLRLLASELSQREIGSELYVSFNTVKAHTRSIFRKLGVSSRADAVARGRELGLV